MLATAAYSILLKKESAHDDHIYCSAWTKTKTSEDSKGPPKDFIVTGGLDCLVKIWLFMNNKLDLVHTLVGHEMAVVSVAVTADGHTVASSSIDSTLMVWDLLTGHKVHVIQEPGTDVWKLAFSPDGTGIITGSHTGKLCIFGTEKASFEKVLDTRGRFVLSVDWSANGNHIVSGSTDGLVCLFDASQGKLLHMVQAHAKSVNSVAFSQDSRSFVTASAEGEVHTYNVASATKQCTAHHATRAMAACFSPDGGRVATALGDGTVVISLTDKLQQLHVFKEHTTTVCDVQFNAEGNRLLTVSKDKSIIIYECPIPPKAVAVAKK